MMVYVQNLRHFLNAQKITQERKKILMNYFIATSLEFSLLCLLYREAYQQSMHKT